MHTRLTASNPPIHAKHWSCTVYSPHSRVTPQIHGDSSGYTIPFGSHLSFYTKFPTFTGLPSSTMSTYSHRVGFVSLPELGDSNAYKTNLWPCLRFDDPYDYVLHQAHLFNLLEYSDVSTRYSVDDIAKLVPRPTDKSTTMDLVYLLGNAAWNFPGGTMRLQWTNNFSAIDSRYADSAGMSPMRPGFSCALSEALFLLLGPEFTQDRLRIISLGEVYMWPCILFDRYEDLVSILREQGILNDELGLTRQFLKIVAWDQLGHNKTPPFVYIFGDATNDGLNRVQIADDSYLHGFSETCGKAFLANAHNKNFMEAMKQAAKATIGNPTAPK